MPQNNKIDPHNIESDNHLGCIVDVFLQGTLHTGICIHQSAQQLTVLLDNDDQVSLSPGRTVLSSKALYAPNQQALTEFLTKLQEVQIQEADLPVLSGQTLEELLESCPEDVRRFALFHYLRNHPEKYYQKKGGFYSRSEAEIQNYLQERQNLHARKQYLDAVLAFFHALKDSGQDHSLTAQEKDQLIGELQMLVQGDKCPDLESIIRTAFPEQNRMDAIQHIRRVLGDFSATEPLLNLSGLPICFPAFEYQDQPAEDTTSNHTSAFCIDDTDTLDYDDALSIKRTEEGYLLGIHVSNLAEDSGNRKQILKLAQARISSLYLPSDIIPMLPRSLSEHIYSLKSEHVRAVLSLYARFDHNYRLLGTDLITDFVRISANLSYAEADELATSQDFAPLFQIATSLKLLRDCPVEKETNRYLYSFKACNQKVQIKKIDTLSPSRAMVEELMIFYNSSIAVFASESKLPVLYRNVNQYFGVNEQVLNSTAFLSTQSEYHPGIGTEAYLHATSPIRRYVDLINQTQVTAMLNNTNPEYTKEDLDQMITLIERRLQLLRDTYNKSERYWCLRYIDQNLLNNPVRGYLKGFWGEYLKVEILPWGKHVLLLTDSRPEDDYFTFVPYFIDWNNYFIKADIV